jgi:hypothetical protein
LFARPEWQRLGKLYRHFPEKPVDLIDSADPAAAGKTGHIEAVCIAETGDAEPCCYCSAWIRTFLVRVTGKGGAMAGNINHLTLRKHIIEILGEPDGPLISKSLLCSSLCIRIHFKFPKNLYFCLQIDNSADLLYKGLPKKPCLLP